MPDPVIIVDDSGVEHEFPPGFDPKKAAGIVRYRTQAHPPSAEDFAPPQRDVSIGNMLVNAAKSIPAGVVNTVKTAYSDQRPEDAALGPARILAPLIRQAAPAHAAEARQALTTASAGRVSEAVGHGAAAVLPFVGPGAAQAGEDIGSGDPERIERGGGNAIGMLASLEAPRIVPPVARMAGPAVRATGRGAAIVAKEAAPTVGAGVGALVGGPAGAMIGGIAGRSAARLLGRVLRKAPEAADPLSEAPPVPVTHGPESSPNAGGRLVQKAPSLQDALLDALNEATQPTPPARITTPPEPNLPAGFTPRATVPKPKPARAAGPAPAATATPPKRAYFLKPLEEMAPSEPVTPTGRPVTLADLPASWRSRVTQPLTKSHSAQLSGDAAAELARRGLSVEDALDAITRNTQLAPNVRLTLRDALLASLRGPQP